MQLAVCSDGGSLRLKRRGISYEPAAKEERQEADRNVDEEYPTPIVVVGDPAAQNRPDRRGCYDHNRVQCKGRRSLGGGNVSTRIACDTGANPPPARPWSMRLESMIPRLGASP